MTMLINNKFSIGQTVYLRTDTEQLQRIVTAIKVCGDNSLFYELSCGREVSDHYDFEIAETIDEEIRVKNL